MGVGSLACAQVLKRHDGPTDDPTARDDIPKQTGTTCRYRAVHTIQYSTFDTIHRRTAWTTALPETLANAVMITPSPTFLASFRPPHFRLAMRVPCGPGSSPSTSQSLSHTAESPKGTEAGQNVIDGAIQSRRCVAPRINHRDIFPPLPQPVCLSIFHSPRVRPGSSARSTGTIGGLIRLNYITVLYGTPARDGTDLGWGGG